MVFTAEACPKVPDGQQNIELPDDRQRLQMIFGNRGFPVCPALLSSGIGCDKLPSVS